MVVVGCGLSSAEGLPSMQKLAKQLIDVMPSKILSKDQGLWEKIEKSLASGISLEQALTENQASKDVNDALTLEIARLIKKSEEPIFSEVLRGQKTLRFSSLVQVFLKSANGIPIITTNYDRLIELSCEVVGYPVDSMFVGNTVGRLDQKESAYSFCRGIRHRQGRKLFLDFTPRIKLLKPHGSLDWYALDDKILRCPHNIDYPPLIIAPGESKYRAGYKEPFDVHRENANREIDKGEKYLIIGYGFNDAHLQSHLAKNLREGKPGLVVTKKLSAAGASLINESPKVMVLTLNGAKTGTTNFRDVDNVLYQLKGDMWDLGKLVREVFR